MVLVAYNMQQQLPYKQALEYHYLFLHLSLSMCQGPINLKELELQFLPLPKHVSQISSGPNYDFYSSTMRFTISSPVVCEFLLAMSS